MSAKAWLVLLGAALMGCGGVGLSAAAPAAAASYGTIDEAIAKGGVEDVKKIIESNPKILQGEGGTKLAPLHQAILRRKTAIALFLIERGADINAPDNAARTPLHLAVERNDRTVLVALLDGKAEPVRRDRIGWTPLHHAAAKNQVELARILLDRGAPPNALSELGGTPLHEAAAGGGVEMVKFLLERGTDPKVRSKPGVTALDLAKEYKNAAVVALLETGL
jgi:ankyrin repeat protein